MKTEKARKKEKKKQKKLQSKVKKGKGPTAAALQGQMQYSSDEDVEGDKLKLKHFQVIDASDTSEPE